MGGSYKDSLTLWKGAPAFVGRNTYLPGLWIKIFFCNGNTVLFREEFCDLQCICSHSLVDVCIIHFFKVSVKLLFARFRCDKDLLLLGL